VDKKIITAILTLAELYTASCNPTKGIKPEIFVSFSQNYVDVKTVL
jgi:hypothetical protein